MNHSQAAFPWRWGQHVAKMAPGRCRDVRPRNVMSVYVREVDWWRDPLWHLDRNFENLEWWTAVVLDASLFCFALFCFVGQDVSFFCECFMRSWSWNKETAIWRMETKSTQFRTWPSQKWKSTPTIWIEPEAIGELATKVGWSEGVVGHARVLIHNLKCWVPPDLPILPILLYYLDSFCNTIDTIDHQKPACKYDIPSGYLT